MGGSHAQRDVFELTLLHAAVGAGRLDVARALLSDRVMLRLASPQSWWLHGSVLKALGEASLGEEAQKRALVLGLGARST